MIQNKNTDVVKIPNTITGFLPIRSATIPQKVEVKDLPSIKEAPAKINNVQVIDIKLLF